MENKWWVIYYGIGTRCDSGSVGPERARERDVQVIHQYDPQCGQAKVAGADYYVWRDSRWWGVDLFGLYDYLASPGWKRVLFGRKIDNEEFNRISARAHKECGFAAKSWEPPWLRYGGDWR